MHLYRDGARFFVAKVLEPRADSRCRSWLHLEDCSNTLIHCIYLHILLLIQIMYNLILVLQLSLLEYSIFLPITSHNSFAYQIVVIVVIGHLKKTLSHTELQMILHG